MPTKLIKESVVIASRNFDLNLARVREFLLKKIPHPKSGFVFPDSNTQELLKSLLARKVFKKLITLIIIRFESSNSDLDRNLYQSCISALLSCTDEELEYFCTEPEIVSLCYIVAPMYMRERDLFASELARCLIPEFIKFKINTPPFPIMEDVSGEISIRRMGFILNPKANNKVNLGMVKFGDFLCGDHKKLTSLTESKIDIIALPRLMSNGPFISPSMPSWISKNIVDKDVLALNSKKFDNFFSALQSGASNLFENYSDGWFDVVENVRWILPLISHGTEPYNYSIHAFRGLVFTSSRWEYRSAQTLVHEAGHNKFSTILDLLSVCENQDEIVFSPVVNANRPISFVFHGCFSFAREVQLTRRILENAPVSDKKSICRYLSESLSKTTAALTLLKNHARVNETGMSILNEIEAEVLGE